jgi:CheY-like chemotaxis protein
MIATLAERTSAARRAAEAPFGVPGAARGRILVVDDDRAFGGFMIAALETRGHDVDWAGCIADGVATLYSHRYDLVVIDLRLPDGSGLDFLRAASDEGLLANSSAIILTGHDFEEPSDIRVFHKTPDIEPLLDKMGQIVASTRRRATSTRPPQAHRGTSNDRQGNGRSTKIELVLYTSSESEKSLKAIRSIRRVLEQYEAADISFAVCDLSGRPSSADEDAVVFTPTLVKRGPGPRTWIVGNLDQPELLVDLLEVSGVDRKRDGR